MAREQKIFDNPWPKIGWWSTAGLIAVGVVLGFLILGSMQQNGPRLGTWAAICRALGITADRGPAGEPQPRLETPTRTAWTRDTLTQIASGKAEHGAFIATSCAACHGEQGVSKSSFFPTLTGMDAAVIYKQLDDFRSEKRSSGAMNAIAQALSQQDSADVASFFASRGNGLPAAKGEPFRAGRTLRENDPIVRLVFAGDPARGIPPCGACHGPADQKLGAPQLKRQQATYIEAQLTAFAQALRRNDINKQMRTIAAQLTQNEIHGLADFYNGLP
jgi:cytochrome c553